MFSKSKTSESTRSYFDNNSINAVSDALNNADRLIIDIGAGMTAAGGLNYTELALCFFFYH